MAERTGMPGGCYETMLPHARAIKRDDFREEEGKTGVLIIAELLRGGYDGADRVRWAGDRYHR